MKTSLEEFFNTIMEFSKFLAWLSVFVVGVIFCINGKINGSQFVSLLNATTLGYFGIKSIEHFSDVVKTSIDSKTATMMAMRPKETKNE